MQKTTHTPKYQPKKVSSYLTFRWNRCKLSCPDIFVMIFNRKIDETAAVRKKKIISLFWRSFSFPSYLVVVNVVVVTARVEFRQQQAAEKGAATSTNQSTFKAARGSPFKTLSHEKSNILFNRGRCKKICNAI